MADINRINNQALVCLPSSNLFAFANDEIAVKRPKSPISDKRFKVGKQYMLQNEGCDGIAPKENDVYELIAEINSINGIEFNSFVMKAIKVNTSMMFTLNKVDCEKLGIEYQKGLQLFPINLNWKEVEKEEIKETKDIEYNENDLSTYPVDLKTNRIKFMMIRLVGFTQIDRYTIITPTHHKINIFDFMNSIAFNFNFEPYSNAFQTKISGKIVTPLIIHKPFHDCYVDNESHSIFIQLDLRGYNLSTNETVGIDPNVLKNKTINDLLTVTWIEKYRISPYLGVSNTGSKIRVWQY